MHGTGCFINALIHQYTEAYNEAQLHILFCCRFCITATKYIMVKPDNVCESPQCYAEVEGPYFQVPDALEVFNETTYNKMSCHETPKSATVSPLF
jgi:hypothetical protein